MKERSWIAGDRCRKRTSILLAAMVLCLTVAVCGWAQAGAADVSVTAGPGVSSGRLAAVRDETDNVLRYYRERYDYTPSWPVQVVIAPDRPSFTELLQREGLTAEQAKRTAEAVNGLYLTSSRKIALQDDPFRNALTLSDVLAHELFHQFQWELKGSATAHQWLLEGSAERARFEMEVWSGRGEKERKIEAANNLLYSRVTGELNPYDLVDKGPRWDSLVKQGFNVYGTAKRMTDLLAEQAGEPSILQYFTELGRNGNREAAFAKAFGMEHREFLEKYRAHVAAGSGHL